MLYCLKTSLNKSSVTVWLRNTLLILVVPQNCQIFSKSCTRTLYSLWVLLVLNFIRILNASNYVYCKRHLLQIQYNSKKERHSQFWKIGKYKRFFELDQLQWGNSCNKWHTPRTVRKVAISTIQCDSKSVSSLDFLRFSLLYFFIPINSLHGDIKVTFSP